MHTLRVIGTVFICLLATHAQATPKDVVNAPPNGVSSVYKNAWKKSADGRTIIKILGVSFAFPKDMEATTTVSATCNKCHLESMLPHEGSSSPSVKSLIASPQQTQIAFNKAQSTGSVHVRFNMNAVPVLINGRVKNVQGVIDFFSPAKTEWSPMAVACSEAKQRDTQDVFVKSAESSSPPSITYCAPAHQRLFKTTRSLFVNCSQISAEQCSIVTLLDQADVQTSYTFFTPTNSGEKKVVRNYQFSKEEWLALDKQLREFSSKVILNRKS